ncbi:MAG: J domain-containing protein [Candidatus Riflebacteria bacterium]|nr:J domain-containing protein [Candidatus Riflebacteria bacterium]
MNVSIKSIQYDFVQQASKGLDIEVKLRFFGKVQGKALVVLFFVNSVTGQIIRSVSPEWADDRGDFISSTDFFFIDNNKRIFSFNFFVPYGVLRVDESTKIKVMSSCVVEGVKYPIVAEKELEYYTTDSDTDIPAITPPIMNVTRDFFARLGLTAEASFEEVKSAYKNKCKEFHPDLYQNLPSSFQDFAKQEFQKIQEAFAYLRDFFQNVGELSTAA